MNGFWAELLLIFLLIVGNGFFAAAEIALVSARKGPIAALALKGDKRAKLVAKLQADPETFLATVQVGISMMTILAGVTGGAVFVDSMQDLVKQIPVAWIRSAAPGIAFALVTLLITYFSMVLGELVPKSITLRRPERVALRLAPPIYALSRITFVAVRFLAISGKVISRLLGGHAQRSAFISEEEVKWLLREGQKHGVFDATERELIAQVFSFADTQVRRAMTARTDMAALDANWPRDKSLQFMASEGYSRYPVYQENLDRIVGVVHTKDVIRILTSGGAIILEDLIRPPMFAPDSQKLGTLLRTMQQKQEHLAIVLDEFGGTAGLITLEDILEEIVGEIRDEHDTETPEFSIDDNGVARIAGKMPIDEFNEYFGVHFDESEADTVAGYVTHLLGHIPTVGEVVETPEVRFRVLEMNDNRIDWLSGEKFKPSKPGELKP